MVYKIRKFKRGKYMSKEPYYIGLTVGPEYAAYAVTNESYNLERFKGQDMWGIYKFKEAETSANRTAIRSARKNIKKEKKRINLLKAYFYDEIMKVDKNFFIRLDNSFFFPEDKEKALNGSRNVLFDDDNYKDADYYNQFPTIFHLRSFLANSKEKADIRLVYLAVSNIMKHRGNFYTKNLEDTSNSVKDIYLNICRLASQSDIHLDEKADTDKLMEILLNPAINNKTKAVLAAQTVKALTKQETALIKLMCGLKIKLVDMFPELADSLEEPDKKASISFSDNNYLDNVDSIEKLAGEDNFALVSAVKELYDAVIIQNIIQGHKFISDAKMASYEKHMNDLKLLKSVLRNNVTSKEFNRFFRSEEPGTYAAYVKSNNSYGKRTRRDSDKGRTQNDLYASIKKLLSKVEEDDSDAEYILDEISKGTFLPKQRITDNRLIPNQLYASELKAILDNSAKHYDFLNEKDESRMTVSERILSVFTFTMPYFVGPTSEYNSRGWAVRKEAGVVMPWNLETKVDIKESAKNFIENMVGKCTYLSGERVLPKASLLYEKYAVLNEVNNIRVDGNKLPVEVKQEIVNRKLMAGKKLTKKQIHSFLVKKGLADMDSLITGIDDKLNNTMSSYKFFSEVFGTLDKDTEVMAENIILWSTIYGTSKTYVKEQIENKYPGKLTAEQMKKVLNFKSDDWGRLSAEFLNMRGSNKETDERISVIDLMWNENISLMELINDERYDFMSVIKEKSKKEVKSIFTFEYDDLNELYATAAQKRAIWAAVKIVREIIKIKGYAPESIFLDTKKMRPKDKKDNRKSRLIDLYKGLKDVSKEWKETMINRIDECDKDGSLKSKKVYLYFLQMGKDMYTWEDINFNVVKTTGDNIYNIDHIYPKHFVKDESLDNIVLTNSEFNGEEKKDIYPVPDKIYEAMHGNWLILRKNGFMSAEKLVRLSDRHPMSDEKRASFIGKSYIQATSSTKMLAEVFNSIFNKDTKIIYAKTQEVADFRKQYGFAKATIYNDHYLAKDAYLNIVVGNVWYTKFTSSPIWFIEKEYRTGKAEYNLNRMYDFDVIRNDRVAWIAERKKKDIAGSIAVVNKVMAKNTPITTTKKLDGHGQITEATLYKGSKTKPEYFPIKTSDDRFKDMAKYGGKTGIANTYAFLVEFTDKKKGRMRCLYTIPLYMADNIKDKKDIEKYCTEKLGLTNPDVRINKIAPGSELEIDGYSYLLGGRSVNQFHVTNNIPMIFSQEWQSYISKIEKYINFKVVDKAVSAEKNLELYDEILSKHSTGVFSKKKLPMYERLLAARKKFIKLSVEEQLQVICQMLTLTRMGTNMANLSLIGEGSSVGIMNMSCNLSKNNSVILVERSITGLYKKKIDMLTV